MGSVLVAFTVAPLHMISRRKAEKVNEDKAKSNSIDNQIKESAFFHFQMRCSAIGVNKKAGCTQWVLPGPWSQNKNRMALGRQLEQHFLKPCKDNDGSRSIHNNIGITT